MCKEQTLEEQVCYLRRENELLKQRVEFLCEQNSQLATEAKVKDKVPLVLIEGNEVTIIE